VTAISRINRLGRLSRSQAKSDQATGGCGSDHVERLSKRLAAIMLQASKERGLKNAARTAAA